MPRVNKTTVERRSSPRKTRSFEVQGRADAGELARMTASDLSLGGLYCTSSADFPEMTRLAVTLMLADPHTDEPQPLDVQAVVFTPSSGSYGLVLHASYFDAERALHPELQVVAPVAGAEGAPQ